VFASQPASTQVGSAIPDFTVQIEDAGGNLVNTDSTDSVSVALGTNPGGGTLSGSATVTAINGVATFHGLSIDEVGTGYTLAASHTGWSGATSGPFNVTARPSPPTQVPIIPTVVPTAVPTESPSGTPTTAAASPTLPAATASEPATTPTAGGTAAATTPSVTSVPGAPTVAGTASPAAGSRNVGIGENDGNMVTLSIQDDSVSPGQTIVLSATVQSVSGPASGTVTFYDGSAVVGTATVTDGVAALTLTPPSRGVHDYRAVFRAASTTEVAVTVGSPVKPLAITNQSHTVLGKLATRCRDVTELGPYQPGCEAIFVHEWLPGAKVVYKLDYPDGTSQASPPVTTDASGDSHYVFAVSYRPPYGVKHGEPRTTGLISVVATSADGTQSKSATLRFAVLPQVLWGAPSSAAVLSDTTQLTLATASDAVATGQPLTLTATVESYAGRPSGSVRFLDGTVFLGTGVLHGDAAVLVIAPNAAGVHMYAAAYRGLHTTPLAVTVGEVAPVLTVSNGRHTVVGGSTSICGQSASLGAAGCEAVFSRWLPGATMTITLSFADGTRQTFQGVTDAQGRLRHVFTVSYQPPPQTKHGAPTTTAWISVVAISKDGMVAKSANIRFAVLPRG
jgi:hypothetical protein